MIFPSSVTSDSSPNPGSSRDLNSRKLPYSRPQHRRGISYLLSWTRCVGISCKLVESRPPTSQPHPASLSTQPWLSIFNIFLFCFSFSLPFLSWPGRRHTHKDIYLVICIYISSSLWFETNFATLILRELYRGLVIVLVLFISAWVKRGEKMAYRNQPATTSQHAAGR